VRSRSLFISYCLGYEQVELLYRTTTNKCIHTLLSHKFIYTMRHSKKFQPLTSHLQGVYLIHSSNKFNKIVQERDNNPWTGPEGSSRLTFTEFIKIDTWESSGCQPYTPAAFTWRKHFWYSFLLKAESTLGPHCGRKDYVNDKFQWHHQESRPRPNGL